MKSLLISLTSLSSRALKFISKNVLFLYYEKYQILLNFTYFSQLISFQCILPFYQYFPSHQLKINAKSFLTRNASLRVKCDTFTSVCLIEMLMFAQVISVAVRVVGFDWLWCCWSFHRCWDSPRSETRCQWDISGISEGLSLNSRLAILNFHMTKLKSRCVLLIMVKIRGLFFFLPTSRIRSTGSWADCTITVPKSHAMFWFR